MNNGISDGNPYNPRLNFPKENPKSDARHRAREAAASEATASETGAPASVKAPGWMKTSAPASEGGELQLRYASRDGDAVEIAAAQAAEDPKEKQLAELRAWAAGVEKELRLQQQRLLERLLKEPGRHVETGDGKFLIILSGPAEIGAEKDDSPGEAQVPEYWNAENTSDRIVHFATQMAKISGMDPSEYAERIAAAVGAGFDQANAETGELPGAAGKLNRDTRELVSAKLAKWLEAGKSEAYNQATQASAISTSDVSSGTQNNQQPANSPVHRQRQDRVG